MNKPNGYEEAKVQGEYTPIDLGGHKLVILKVEELNSSNGNQYIKVSFDTAKDDAQPGFYAASYKSDTRDQKKWGGVATVFPTDKEGKTSKQFKTFCTSIERSNPGFKMVWGAGFCDALKNKAIGGVFGEEEYLNGIGEVKTARKLFWFRSIEGVEDAQIPRKRTVEPVQPMDTGYIPADDDADLPFM